MLGICGACNAPRVHPFIPLRRYTLDLSVREQRCVAASLVALSWKCPGRRWMDGTYNGKRFAEPALWVTRLPKDGVLEVRSPLPRLHRDRAHRCHICTGTGPTPAHICRFRTWTMNHRG